MLVCVACFAPGLALLSHYFKSSTCVSLFECPFFFSAIFSAMERALAAHVDTILATHMPRPLSDNVNANDVTMDVNAEVDNNCPPNIMAITDSCTNEG